MPRVNRTYKVTLEVTIQVGVIVDARTSQEAEVDALNGKGRWIIPDIRDPRRDFKVLGIEEVR